MLPPCARLPTSPSHLTPNWPFYPQVGVGKLVGLVGDCGGPSSQCLFYVGQRPSTSGSFSRFSGVLYSAMIYPKNDLRSFPSGGAITTTTTPPSTTAATARPPSRLARRVYVGQDEQFVVTGLAPFSRFVAYVKAFNSVAHVVSPTASFATEQAPPSGVLGPAVVIDASFTAAIRWQPPQQPNGVVTSYKVTFFPAVSPAERTTVFSGLGFEAAAGPLEPYTRYVFELVAVSIGGASDPSSTAVVSPEIGKLRGRLPLGSPCRAANPSRCRRLTDEPLAARL